MHVRVKFLEVDIFCNLIFSMLCTGQRNSTIFTRVNRVPSGTIMLQSVLQSVLHYDAMCCGV